MAVLPQPLLLQKLPKTSITKTNLRISNLERDFSRQEHKSNNIINFLKKSHQKNYQGSHLAEWVTSPENQTLSELNQKQARKSKRNFIALTTEEAKEVSNAKKPHLTISQPTKGRRNQRKTRGQAKSLQSTTKKSI